MVVHRVGKILQDVFLVWAEETYMGNIESIQDTRKYLIMHDGKSKRGRFQKFPDHLVQNEADKKMVLSTNLAVETIGYFTGLIDDTMEGKEVAHTVKEPARRTKIVYFHGPCSRPDRAATLVVYVNNKDVSKYWVLDPTGPQFGQFSPTMDEDEYFNLHVDKMLPNPNPKWGYSKRFFKCMVKKDGNIGLIPWISWDTVDIVYKVVEAWKNWSRLTLPGFCASRTQSSKSIA
jgi:hypothetical protein